MSPIPACRRVKMTYLYKIIKFFDKKTGLQHDSGSLSNYTAQSGNEINYIQMHKQLVLFHCLRCCRRNGLGSQRAFGRWHPSRHALIVRHRHPQGTSKGFKNGFRLMVGVFAAQVVNMQGNHGMIDQAVKKFFK